MTDDDRLPAGDPGSDDPLTRDLTELSNDLPDLGVVRSTVRARLKTRQRRRRGAALTLAAASVVGVTVGGVALNATQAAPAPTPAVAAFSTAPSTAAAMSPQDSRPASVAAQDSRPAAFAAQTSSSSPRAVYAAENVLLLLTDTRPTGNAPAVAGDAAAGVEGTSDTTMVVHFSADRQHVSVLWIPRDISIPAPACKSWNPTTGAASDTASSVPPGQPLLFKSAYAVGGPRCTTAAVQALTGLKIDRIVGIDYTGFQTVVDAIGGITVNACAPVLDGTLGTILPAAGTQKVTGADALNLFRAREVVGENGSEMAQIRRQQNLFSALIGQIDQTGTLLDPAKLDALLNVFTRNTFTINVNLEYLVNLAGSIGTLTPAQLSFYTLPVDSSAADPKILRVKQPQANQLTQAIDNDQTASATSPTTGNRSDQSTGSLTTVRKTAQGDSGAASCIGAAK